MSVANFCFAGNCVGDAPDRAGLIEKFAAVCAEVVSAIESREKNFIFASFQIINVKSCAGTCGAGNAGLKSALRNRNVKNFSFASVAVAVEARGNRKLRDAIAQAIQISLERLGSLVVGFGFFLFVGDWSSGGFVVSRFVGGL